MKKLLFATAIAASAAAFANPINAVGFENYTAGQTFENGGDENNEVGGTDKYFCFDGGSNSSVVTNVSPSTTRTAYFGSLKPTPPANANYLALDTEGGTFWRSINTIINSGETYSLGAEQTVAATGTYLDTLVQFTVTEDDAPTVGADDKLAIWLQAGEGTTNLMVRASYVEDTGSVICVPTNFVVDAGKDIVPGEWYRLTVKAVADVTKAGTDIAANAIVGFTIYIDNNPVVAETATFAQSYISTATDPDWGWINDTTTIPLLQSKTVFPSLAGKSNVASLQGVGFQGTGAVDEIVWTEEDPFPAAVVEFTLTRSIGENVTAAAFTIGEDAINFENNEASIVSNATVTIAQPTFTQGYQLAALTIGGTAVADPEFPYSFTMTANTTVEITAEQIPVTEDWVDNPATEITAGDTAATAYPGLASSALASADAQKLTRWAKANDIAYNDIKNDTTGTYTEAYLLNCAVADVEDEKEEFVANITIGANGTPVVTAPAGKNYNGKLQLKGKVNLTDATWTPVEAASTTYKFYMYELSL